jgi:RNA polymerase sigma-70 factor (ECF subfamily)
MIVRLVVTFFEKWRIFLHASFVYLYQGKGGYCMVWFDLHNVLHRYCLSLTGSSWDADDLAQDAWVRTIEALKRFGHANPEALLLRVAKNSWIDQSRRNKHMTSLQQAVFLLRDVFGYSSVESATMLGTTDGAVKTALHRARQTLSRVREEIGEVKLPIPADVDADQEETVRLVAQAYLDGDVATLIELVQASMAKRTEAHSVLRMAA